MRIPRYAVWYKDNFYRKDGEFPYTPTYILAEVQTLYITKSKARVKNFCN